MENIDHIVRVVALLTFGTMALKAPQWVEQLNVLAVALVFIGNFVAIGLGIFAGLVLFGKRASRKIDRDIRGTYRKM